MAGPWEKYASDAAPAGPWSKYASDAAPAPESDPAIFQPMFGSSEDAARSVGQDAKLGRSVLKGLGTGFLGLPGLASDAAINAAYGGKKLLAKTGLVDAPDPKNYYQGDGGYLPVSGALSSTMDRGLDAAGLPKPENAAERIGLGAVEGAAGGVGGFLAGRVAQAGRGLGSFMASTPAPVQVASGAAAGAAAQGAGEVMQTPLGSQLPEWTPAAVGMATGAISGGALAKAAQRGAQAPVPTRGALAAERDGAYQRARDANVEVTAPAFARLHDGVRQDLDAAGIFQDVKPGPLAAALLEPFENSRVSNAPVPFNRIEAIRRNVGAASRSQDATERRVAGIIRDRIDRFMERDATPADLIEPTQGAGARALADTRQGRALASRVRKDTALENALEAKADTAGSSGSGANAQNAARQGIRPMIAPGSPAARKMGFTGEETEQARSIVRGGAFENVARAVGKLAPTGAVSAIPSALAVTATGAGGLALPAVGYLAKGVSERIQRGKVDRLGETIRRGYAVPEASGTQGRAAGAVGGFLSADPGNKRRGRYR